MKFHQSQIFKFSLTSLSILALLSSPVFADKICLKIAGSKITRKIVASNKKCAKGFSEIVDTIKLVGPAGAQGTPGLNGSSTSDFIWGTGADGDLTLSGVTTIDSLKQYNNITVSSGAVVSVPAGSTIRCAGSITVAGTLVSNSGGAGGKIQQFDGSSVTAQVRSSKSSLNLSPAPAGEIIIRSNLGSGSTALGGVNQTASADIDSLKNALKVSSVYGGGGGGALDGEGGVGGGSFAILCKQGITVSSSGVLNLNGSAGSLGGGGGSGGLALLATNGTLAMQGSILAAGGAGGAAYAISAEGAAGGGGGGGGVVNLLGATLSVTGSVNVTGGLGAPSATGVSGFYRSGGGAGGSLGGIGGNGGTVQNSTDSGLNDTATAGTNGATGQVFQKTVTGGDVAAVLM